VAMGAALVIAVVLAAEDQRDGDGDDRRDDGDGNPDGDFVSQCFGSRCKKILLSLSADVADARRLFF
jgi:hypothetical protein